MALEIIVGGWEHECCGPKIERHQRVQWTCIVHSDGRLYETHHELEGLNTADVTGTVVDLELVQIDGSRVAITRIPSGRALRGCDEHDDGGFLATHTDDVVEGLTGEFVVTVEPATRHIRANIVEAQPGSPA